MQPAASAQQKKTGQMVPRTSPEQPFQLELLFTETYRRYQQAHPALREAHCLRVQAPALFQPIEGGDRLAGRIRPALVGFSPDEWGTAAFGYYHLPDAIAGALETHDLDADTRRQVGAMTAFWDAESTAAKVRAAYPPPMARALPSDDWMNTHGVAFPLYRLTGGTLDAPLLFRLGLPGLKARVEARREEARAAGGDADLFAGMALALDVLADVVRRYEAEARAAAGGAADAARRAECLAMAEALASLLAGPPPSFRAALQLYWLYALIGDIRNHGRLDVALGPLLARDLEKGTLGEDEALGLVQSLWQLMADRETRVHNRVIVGGVGRPDEPDADRFALLAIEASRTVLEAEPQLSLRFYAGQHPALMARALDVIGEGRTFPLLYNDDVNVPAVMAAFGVDRDVAEQYVPYGCGEYVIWHRSMGTPSGVINLLKALEVTLHDGRDPLTGRQAGLALGRFEDFATFEDLWKAYARQVEHFVELMAEQEALEYRVAGGEAPCLFLSMLFGDALERGRGVCAGGARWLGGTLETYGNTNAADSLTAIQELVYDRRLITPAQLLDALRADFEGHDRLRALLRDAPKYGNDDARADAMLCRVHDHVCNATRAQAARVGLDSYLVVVINNAANTLLGHWTGASADGRRAGQPMNNGNAPSSGCDRKGVTALLNSMLKPSTAIHAGAVQNMKFGPDLFGARRPQLEALLEAYFEGGGAQAMISVVRRGDLERAMSHPEAYGHLFVRVGGFSARFVDLGRDVQLEILHRTLY